MTVMIDKIKLALLDIYLRDFTSYYITEPEQELKENIQY